MFIIILIPGLFIGAHPFQILLSPAKPTHIGTPLFFDPRAFYRRFFIKLDMCGVGGAKTPQKTPFFENLRFWHKDETRFWAIFRGVFWGSKKGSFLMTLQKPPKIGKKQSFCHKLKKQLILHKTKEFHYLLKTTRNS